MLIAAAYMLSGPGRIDTIDAQARYDVTRNILQEGKPIVTDPVQMHRAWPGRDGHRYYYGISSSVAAVPLVALGLALEPEARGLSQFLFSFTSAFFGAATLVLLFMTWELLGVTRRAAIGWTLAVAFSTLLWPVAATAFDQAQHACFVMLAAYAGLRAARDDLGRFAFLAGAACGVLLNYHEALAVLVPGLGLTCMREGERIFAFAKSKRFLLFVAGSGIGLVFLLAFNAYRYSGASASATSVAAAPDVFVNPLVGAAGLLFSAGKSIFLYSPPIVLAIAGWRQFYRGSKPFARALLITIGAHFVLIANLTFFSGDWCWGPRYLVVTLPLVCLAMPFVQVRRSIKIAVIGLGITIQLLGISVDHHRWFWDNKLQDDFFLDSGGYFVRSQLFARPSELVAVMKWDGPLDIRRYAPNYYRSPTYTTFSNSPARRAEITQWMKQFSLVYLPKPWPLWMSRFPEYQQPVAWKRWALLALLMMVAGGVLIRQALVDPAHRAGPAP